MRIFVSSLLLLFMLLPAISQEKEKKKPKNNVPEGVEVIRDLEFAKPNGYSLKLDLYRPKERTEELPIVIWVHGGGWKNGSKTNCKASWLAQHGFAVASISYRLTDVAQWPAQIDDCRASVRWLRANAKEHGLNPKNIGVFGSSAGGHLVALMGTRPVDEAGRVQAVCDWFGPTDLLTMPPNNVGNGRTEEDIAQSNGALLLGATVRDIPDKAKDASALNHVSSDDAPFLIMHGSEDPGVPLDQSIKFHEKLRAADVEAELIVIDGAKHGGPEFNEEKQQLRILEFFKKHLVRAS